MVEVVIKNELEKAYVVREPGALPQIHIGTDMNLEIIREHLSNQVTQAEFDKFTKLWSEDVYPRVFVQGENYLKIKDKN